MGFKTYNFRTQNYFTFFQNTKKFDELCLSPDFNKVFLFIKVGFIVSTFAYTFSNYTLQSGKYMNSTERVYSLWHVHVKWKPTQTNHWENWDNISHYSFLEWFPKRFIKTCYIIKYFVPSVLNNNLFQKLISTSVIFVLLDLVSGVKLSSIMPCVYKVSGKPLRMDNFSTP